LKDVITQLEPDLFKKVTGLSVKDFALLCELNVFNATLMNDAIFKFRRYEEASLDYTGINKHEGESVGGWYTVISVDDYNALYKKQADEEPVLVKTENSFKPEVQTKMNMRLEKPIKTPNLNKHNTVHYEQKPQPVQAAAEKPKVVLIKKGK
ncbi:MAG: hypothetical protein MJ052_06105, partial [Sphaerochaetaceae bacterium]|nr:hypothetical protein [Sphaerochaetaceae bacterium]